MTRLEKPIRLLTMAAIVGAAGLSTGCAHVTPKQLDASLATMRADMTQQMKAGDDKVAGDLGARMDALEGRVAALEQDLKSLHNDFDVTVQRLEGQLRFDVPVYFGFDSAEIGGDGKAVLTRFGEVAQKYYPGAAITVEGFTDASGSAAYNMRLGKRRADAVVAYLTNNGISGDQLKAVSYGENTARLVKPGEKGPGQAGWQNRRVVMVIDDAGQTPSSVISSSQGN
ncbi:MAG: OmpA family protein [Gemmatimonadetes bacterium]|nr:OmpA family protein [Gemmatimonadota bacterium]